MLAVQWEGQNYLIAGGFILLAFVCLFGLYAIICWENRGNHRGN